eukprot:m.103756 g.103756  ORF g.103756 m.103756 type:complete len:200 (-) comp16842_c0_seq1:97-696(-)
MNQSETVELLREATAVFAIRDDAEALAKTIQDDRELREKWSKEQTDAREIIKGLTKQLETIQEKLAPLDSVKSHEEQLDALENAKFSLAKNCNTIEQKLQQKETEAAAIEREIVSMQEDLERGIVDTTVENPKMKHAVNLYSMISNIEWLPPREEGDTRVAGTAMNKTTGKLRNFSIDSSKQSADWITDHLWGLVTPVA